MYQSFMYCINAHNLLVQIGQEKEHIITIAFIVPAKNPKFTRNLCLLYPIIWLQAIFSEARNCLLLTLLPLESEIHLIVKPNSLLYKMSLCPFDAMLGS